MKRAIFYLVFLVAVLSSLIVWLLWSPKRDKQIEVLKGNIKERDLKIESIYSEGCRCKFEDEKIIFEGVKK